MNMVDRWTVRIFIGQHDEFTSAEARLTTRDTTWLRGTGVARRDPSVPRAAEVDEEVAVGRALLELGRRLLDGAAETGGVGGTESPGRQPGADCPA